MSSQRTDHLDVKASICHSNFNDRSRIHHHLSLCTRGNRAETLTDWARRLGYEFANDSQSAIALTMNGSTKSRAKHIDTKYHFIREAIANGHVELIFSHLSQWLLMLSLTKYPVIDSSSFDSRWVSDCRLIVFWIAYIKVFCKWECWNMLCFLLSMLDNGFYILLLNRKML